MGHRNQLAEFLPCHVHLDRLRKGERWWAAEAVLRALGLALLGLCAALGQIAHRLAATPTPHQATLRDFAVCTAIVLALSSGIALSLFGPGLFRRGAGSAPQRLVLEE